MSRELGGSHFAALILSALVVACGGGDAAPTEPARADVRVTVSGGTVQAPDTVEPGWRRVRVEEDGRGHIVVVFRLADSLEASDTAALLHALDTAAVTPAMATALGGPEVGDTGEVVIHFTPGRYLVGCVRRGDDGHRHLGSGEARLVIVPSGRADSAAAAPPVASDTIRMVDFAYAGPERWAAGPQMLRVENAGRQDHQVRLARLRTGASVSDWLGAEEPGDVATAVAGVARTGPGEAAYLPVDLPPGEYVMYCLVADPGSGEPHVALGMLRAIRVE